MTNKILSHCCIGQLAAVLLSTSLHGMSGIAELPIHEKQLHQVARDTTYGAPETLYSPNKDETNSKLSDLSDNENDEDEVIILTPAEEAYVKRYINQVYQGQHNACMVDLGVFSLINTLMCLCGGNIPAITWNTWHKESSLSENFFAPMDQQLIEIEDVPYQRKEAGVWYGNEKALKANAEAARNKAEEMMADVFCDVENFFPYIEKFLTFASYFSPLSLFAFPAKGVAIMPICETLNPEKELPNCIKKKLQDANIGFVLKYCSNGLCKALEGSLSEALEKVKDYVGLHNDHSIKVYFLEDFFGLDRSNNIPTYEELSDFAYYHNLRGNFLSFSVYKWILNIDANKFERTKQYHIGVSDSLAKAVKNKNINLITFSRKGPLQDFHISVLDSTQRDTLFGRARDAIVPGKFNMIVFPESFFGNIDGAKDCPFSNDEVQKVIDQCKSVIGGPSNVLVAFNFLQKFKVSQASTWLQGWKMPITIPKGAKEQTKDEIAFTQQGGLFEKKFTAKSNNHFANYNLFMWNNEPIAVYRKSTYYREVDTILGEYDDFVYEYGNWKTKILKSKVSRAERVAQKLFGGDSPLIVSRICSDMTYTFISSKQVLKKQQYTPHSELMRLLKDSAVLLIQANMLGRNVIGSYIPKILGEMNDGLYILRCDTVNRRENARMGFVKKDEVLVNFPFLPMATTAQYEMFVAQMPIPMDQIKTDRR